MHKEEAQVSKARSGFHGGQLEAREIRSRLLNAKSVEHRGQRLLLLPMYESESHMRLRPRKRIRRPELLLRFACS